MVDTSLPLHFRPMTAEDASAVIDLANEVHGDNYLNPTSMADYFRRSFTAAGRPLTWLAFVGPELVGLRLTLAPGQWPVDSWCTPEAWPLPDDALCYFKCAAVSEQAQGLGIGKSLLYHAAIEAAAAGCAGGLAHIWRQSPHNSAYAYFSRCGGELIKDHPNRWLRASREEGYYCPVCDGECHCTAAEMILPFANIQLTPAKDHG